MEEKGMEKGLNHKGETDSDVPSFNDATEHYQNIMGVPSKRADIKSMPKPLRWFAYFFYLVIVLGVLLFIISWAMQN